MLGPIADDDEGARYHVREVREERVRLGDEAPRPPRRRSLSGDFDLDAALLEFLLSEPPPLELGSLPPEAILDSIPPLTKAQIAPLHLTDEGDPFVDHVQAAAIGLPRRTAAAPPPVPPASAVVRARKLVKQLETVGPGDEAPTVQALLRVGPDGLPTVADAFPGLLWFDRRVPYSAVARGRDVSPVARALVAFGDAATPSVARLLESVHADIRFYALLVAQDILAEDGAAGDTAGQLVHAIALRALDPDEDVRAVAAAALVGLDGRRAAPARARLRRVLEEDATPRAQRLHAIHALARMRDAETVPVLIATWRPFDPELSELTGRALSVLTGRPLELDPARWAAWWKKHRSQARVEWLIEALESTDASLFDFVVGELATASGQTLGAADARSKRERKRLAAAYRAWWRGAARSRG